MDLQDKDLKQLEEKGISKEELQSQLNRFEHGVPDVEILKSAGIEEGILKINDKDLQQYIDFYDQKNNIEVLKFIPASGAATRMFKLLHQFLSEVEIDEKSILKTLEEKQYKELKKLFEQIDHLAFFEEAEKVSKANTRNYKDLSDEEKKLVILKNVISEEGLNLSHLPKGLIPFHEYKDKTLTPFEEHLEESTSYAEKNGKVKLHFTIAEGLEKHFDKVFEQYLKHQAQENIQYSIDYSYQKASTDTIAVNQDNSFYRDSNGNLFFRPGGHGALIYNLNQLDADVIFIKNIDNISKKDEHKADTTTYKKALAGLLLTLKHQLDNYLKALEEESINKNKILEIQNFAKEQLNIANPSENREALFRQLYRPLRICGMVINDGAPGGGPFWIKDKTGRISLQIVETSQMDLNNKTQKSILESATHFNPVDIVCSTKDHRDKKFNLLNYINPERAFIANKSVDGHPIKALERPGLWNGAMEYWHSIFVEVPSTTFNPVKTVLDLLKPAHQSR